MVRIYTRLLRSSSLIDQMKNKVLPILSYLSTIPIFLTAFPTTQPSPPFTLQNFNVPANNTLIANLTSTFSDALELIKVVVGLTAWNNARTFDLYFPPSATNDVAAVFQKMYHRGNAYNGASDTFSNLIFDNEDFFKDPKDGKEHKGFCDRSSVAAYTLNPPQVEREKIHICERSWGFFPRLRDLDPEVVCGRERMYTEFVVLHLLLMELWWMVGLLRQRSESCWVVLIDDLRWIE